MKIRPEHMPFGDPCVICKCARLDHRISHAPQGDPCGRANCGMPAENHRIRDGEERKEANARYALTEVGKETYQQAQARYRLSHPQFFPGYTPRPVRNENREKKKSLTRKKRERIQEKTEAQKAEALARKRERDASFTKKSRSPPRQYIGVDGEGQTQTLPDGTTEHCYVFLAASNLDGTRTWSVEATTWRDAWDSEKEWLDKHGNTQRGMYNKRIRSLPTKACADFFLSLPKRSKLFSYGFNYDITKIIEDAPDLRIYRLMRPEERPNEKNEKSGPAEQRMIGETYMNMQGTKFVIREGFRSVTIWDIVKFYGCKFVSALETWKVGTQELYDRMTIMKEKRGEFDKEPPHKVEEYCLEECACMAQLAKKLDDAHVKVGLPIRKYYGPGSSAGVMLQDMGILEKIVKPPENMMDAVARAFFGGRFELSERGLIDEPIFSRDISSAYPYQLCFLPCLLHGKWRLTDKREEIEGKTALIHYGFSEIESSICQGSESWGPFPFRNTKGDICYPATSGGGWVYQDEFLAGERLFPRVRFREAWVHETDCDCKPFEKIPYYYLYRIYLGKEGAGLTVKLMINSCYGKLAQSIGNAKFNCWLWAGLITSGCRAQLLNLMAKAPSLSDILMVATDGIASRQWLPFPEPRDTGTSFLLADDAQSIDPSKPNPKPLGGWEAPTHLGGQDCRCMPNGEDCQRKGEERVNERGIFLARPGIYFPLNPSRDDIKKEIKGRGVGRGVIFDNYQRIIDSWQRDKGAEAVKVANVSRFCGAKTSIHRSGKKAPYKYTRADGSTGDEKPRYGNWVMREVKMGFHPEPKRSAVDSDGKRLLLWYLPSDIESQPYNEAVAATSTEALELKQAELEALEQPNIDFSVFETTEEMPLGYG